MSYKDDALENDNSRDTRDNLSVIILEGKTRTWYTGMF